jgi:hypothetical protein
MKTQILAALGEGGLQQATALNAGLAANDRLKYVFSLLQMAAEHARQPEQPAPTLKHERLACGIDDADLDLVVPSAREAGKACRIHRATRIMLRIGEDLRLMAAPVLAAKEPGFDARLERVLAALPDTKGDLVDLAAIASMMQAGQGTVDSPHRLVMDLHKRLNALQAAMAQETLDGAAAYDLEPADRPMVSAFMTGVNRTARLKFNHSGLATTATRAGGRLVIQNDIGTTDAMSSSCMCRTGLSA